MCGCAVYFFYLLPPFLLLKLTYCGFHFIKQPTLWISWIFLKAGTRGIARVFRREGGETLNAWLEGTGGGG